MADASLSRRDVLKLSLFGTAVVALPIASTLRADSVSELPANRLPRPYARQATFVQPPVLTPASTLPNGRGLVTITQAEARLPIVPGFSTRMWVYNGTFPGPTIKVQRKQLVTVRQINRMPPTHPIFRYEFTTSTHLHGAPSRPQFDGYANDTTRPGFFKDYEYDNPQEGRTLWYHDHAVHHTANNVYTGLAAQYHIADALEDRLGLPSGDFDVPVIINDVAFRSDGQLLYDDRSRSSLMGDVILMNGVPWPAVPVEPRKYRLRLLNASVSRGYRLALGNGGPMTVIGTDGGLVPDKQVVTELKIGMAERYEVVIDFQPYRGRSVELVNRGVKNSIDFDNTRKVMRFDVADKAPDQVDQTNNGPVPDQLDSVKRVMGLLPAQARRTRRLRFERQNGEWTINGQTWAEVEASGFQDVIADPAPNDIEIWELQNNSGGWFHPIHIHLIDFRVLDRNGRPPAPFERGPKDVVYLGEGEVVRLLMRFDGGTGRYMMHCHNTVHEDHDMMFQFRVGADVDDRADAGFNDPLGVRAISVDQLPAG